MGKRKWLRLLAVLAAFALVATACGSSDDGGADEGATETTESADTSDDGGDADAGSDDAGSDDADPGSAEADAGSDDSDSGDEGVVTSDNVTDSLGQVEVDESANCASETEFDPGTYAPSGDLQVAMAIGIQTLNPHDEQGPASFSFYGWMYEGLVRQSVEGTVVPWLAKCWEANDAGDAVTFFLHENVTFHDGAPFNADAVKANIEHIKTAGPPEVLPPVAGQMAVVDTVEVVDDLTVTFNLNAPAEALLLSGLIRHSGWMVSPNSLGNVGASPIGTSPYMVDSTSADNTEINLVAYEDYWQPGLVGLETATLHSTRDIQANFDGLNAGQFDTAVIVNSLADQAPGFSQNTTVRIGFVVADWQGEQIPALANRDVRCAIAQALNRTGLQTQLGSPAESAIKQFAAGPGDYAYIDDLESPDFDLEAAKAAFAATGEEGFTFRNGHLPGGFWPVVSTGYGTALAELGITMENEPLDPPTAGTMFGNLIEGKYPIQIIAYNEPNALMSLIARTGQSAFNPSKVSPDGVDELVAAAKTKSFEEGEADVAAAWKIMIEECIFIINNILTTTVGIGPGVTGVNHTGGVPISYWPHGVRNSN